MATSDEEIKPLMGPQSSEGAPEGPPKKAGRVRKATLRGVLSTAFIAVGVYLFAALASRTIMWGDGGLTTDTVTGGDSPSESSLDADGAVVEPSGLVNPNNGTHPTLTSTEDCAGDVSLPVLGGVDVVAYWGLSEGAQPVLGKPALMALYGDYRFFFSSIDNLRAFENDPVKYIPAYGGFCSFGVAAEPVWTAETLGPFGDPSKWTISSDGKLHVFRSRLPMVKFSLKTAEYLEAGDSNWDSWFPASSLEPEPLNTACLCSEEMCADA